MSDILENELSSIIESTPDYEIKEQETNVKYVKNAYYTWRSKCIDIKDTEMMRILQCSGFEKIENL